MKYESLIFYHSKAIAQCSSLKVGQTSRSRSGGEKIKVSIERSCQKEHTYEM
jgi:hypothetical protein